MKAFAEWQRQQKALQELSRDVHRAQYKLLKAIKGGSVK